MKFTEDKEEKTIQDNTEQRIECPRCHDKLSIKLSICKSGANREEMDDVLYT